jgi:flavocytochrome c
VLIVACTGLLNACTSSPTPTDADVIVIGSGIAGLSAALEANSQGAGVLIIETSSVAGGHAVKAGGFALVGTPLQERKGLKDTPNIAYDDMMAWGEDPDPDWVRLFVDNSRSEIHDWLAGFGIQFTILLDTPEDTVPRFHFAGGAAVNVIIPMLREAAHRDNLDFVMNAEAVNLALNKAGIYNVQSRNTRTGALRSYTAPAIVIATGGFQSNLELVRQNFHPRNSRHGTAPEHLLIGSGKYAAGTGIRLGQASGAQLMRMDRQVTFINGLPDPQDPEHGLHVENPAAIRINAKGKRFVNESAHSKAIESAVMSLDQRMHWLVFDDRGRKKFRIRGAVWLNRNTIASEILNNPDIVHKADTIAALATAAGLNADSLQATLDRYNRFVANGEDEDFARFGPLSGQSQPAGKSVTSPPFYAVRLLPMTRKSMGGLAIDINTQVIGQNNQPIDGLFAAGEATGVAGINGSHGGSGTFLAPSVLTGRIAGRNSAASARHAGTITPAFNHTNEQPLITTAANPEVPLMTSAEVSGLLKHERAGYWHWERSHTIVIERALACTDCHSPDWPTKPATTLHQQLLKLETCRQCH